jgi:alpha-D-ribose 1-methylphosphonate 5-triphosphate synthase subunit PhnL
MSGKLKSVLIRLQEANQTIDKQQKQIEHLKKLIEIMNKYGSKNDNHKTNH